MASEFGFDFLRDRLKLQRQQRNPRSLFDQWHGRQPAGEKPVQRGHHYALVDEADSILIDEARTPLVISGGVRPARTEEQGADPYVD